MISIVYIASPSRSGSSLLEDKIAQTFGAVSCGELRRIGQFYAEDATRVQRKAEQIRCSCGAPVKSCKYWRAIQSSSGLKFGADDFHSRENGFQRALFKISVLCAGSRFTRFVSNYYPPFSRELVVAENVYRIYRAIYAVTGHNVIVDSSKQIYHYLLLRAYRPNGVKLVFLLRDGRAVISSMLRDGLAQLRAQKMAETGNHSMTSPEIVRDAALSWMRSVIGIMAAFCLTKRKARARVRYEELCENPEVVLRRVGNRFNLTSNRAGPGCSGHVIGGSPSRYNGGFSEVVYRSEWHSLWSFDHERQLGFVGKSLSWIIGYRFLYRPKQ